MIHTEFKANQTAAAYVAGALDESAREAFELHLFDCIECLQEVETWRAIKHNLPTSGSVVHLPVRGRRWADLGGWRFAASVVGTGALGAVLGWFGKASTSSELDSTRTVIVNLPAVSRGAEECTAAHLARDTRTVILRVPGVPAGAQVVALDAERRALPPTVYVSRTQPDGSHLLRIDASVLHQGDIQLEAHEQNGANNPVGCVSRASSVSDKVRQ